MERDIVHVSVPKKSPADPATPLARRSLEVLAYWNCRLKTRELVIDGHRNRRQQPYREPQNTNSATLRWRSEIRLERGSASGTWFNREMHC